MHMGLVETALTRLSVANPQSLHHTLCYNSSYSQVPGALNHCDWLQSRQAIVNGQSDVLIRWTPAIASPAACQPTNLIGSPSISISKKEACSTPLLLGVAGGGGELLLNCAVVRASPISTVAEIATSQSLVNLHCMAASLALGCTQRGSYSAKGHVSAF